MQHQQQRVKQGKVGHVRWANAYNIVSPFRPACPRNIATFQPRCVFFPIGSFISDSGRSCINTGLSAL